MFCSFPITQSLGGGLYLNLPWRRPLSYRNQSIDLQNKSVDWFLYDIGLRHERVKEEQACTSQEKNLVNILRNIRCFLKGILAWKIFSVPFLILFQQSPFHSQYLNGPNGRQQICKSEYITFPIWDDPFSTYPKFSEKLTFFTPLIRT